MVMPCSRSAASPSTSSAKSSSPPRVPTLCESRSRAASWSSKISCDSYSSRPLGGEVQRHDRDLLLPDVLPDIELGPVRQRKHANTLPGALAGVVERPELGALLLGVPAVLGGAERKNALLGATRLLGAPRAAERRIEAVLVERLAERLGLHDIGVQLRAVGERANA